MISNKKAVECAQTLVEYCAAQRGCQNCIFRLFAPEEWKCNIEAIDLREALGCIEAKKKHGGYID